jgi:hypothetical protein
MENENENGNENGTFRARRHCARTSTFGEEKKIVDA